MDSVLVLSQITESGATEMLEKIFFYSSVLTCLAALLFIIFATGRNIELRHFLETIALVNLINSLCFYFLCKFK